MRAILRFLKPYKKKIVLAMLLLTVAALCNLLLPTIMSEILDEGIKKADLPYILRCCGGMFLVAALSLACMVGGRRLNSEVEARVSGDIRAEVFRQVNAMEFADFNRIGAAALLTRSTHDVGTLSRVFSMLSTSIVTVPVLFFGGVILSLQKDVLLSLLLLAFVPLVFLVVFWVGKNVGPLYKISNKYIDIQNDIMRERLHGIRVIRAFNKEQEEQDKIAEATHVMAENIINANVRMGTIGPMAVLLLNLATVWILYVGAGRIELGLGGLGGSDVFAIIQYVALVSGGVLMASMALVMLPHAQVCAKRIGEVFENASVPESTEGEKHIFSGEIRVEDLCFRYADAAIPAIENISLHILPGQKAAIIGGTGSGKSTLLQMLLAFRKPTAGRIFFDGVELFRLSPREIRKNISCVLQKTAVYSGTIRHNLQMGKPGASDEEILEAAKIAQLYDFIMSLPEGLDYNLTQSGTNLSGGQKQRLCIARAILKDAPIYIFDDSFSALDFLTEANLRKALNEKIRGKTQIVITQRITSAMSADQIFVMDKGRLVDHGVHEKLMERCSIYQEIYASQTGRGGAKK